MFRIFYTLLWVLPWVTLANPIEDRLVSLCEPGKLATLSERGAIPRIQKIVYWLEMGRREGQSPRQLMNDVMHRVGWLEDERGRLTVTAMVRNLNIATKLGCTDDEGMAEMRRGKSPTIRFGPYAGDQLSVDHILPLARYPQLDNVLANLELMPLKMNIRKSDLMGQRQFDMVIKFQAAGLLKGPKTSLRTLFSKWIANRHGSVWLIRTS